MSLRVKVYDNGDHTCLVWLPDDLKPIATCRGFSIKRVKNGSVTYLHGFVGFSDQQRLDPSAPWRMPLQRYMWWDYDVQPGDKVQYSVIPVCGPNSTALQLNTAAASSMTSELLVSGQSSPHVSAYFNKGIVATQWIARVFDGAPNKASLLSQVEEVGNPLRAALSGLLRPELLDLLERARDGGGTIYAALYELNDPELIKGLTALGTRCNLILGNGAFKSNTPPHNDENAGIRETLRDQVTLFDRIVTKGHFAHNKFVVFCDAQGKARSVLTGSTNWTFTGLCTQANNAILIEDGDVAQDYLNAWHRLREADNGYPPELVAGNSVAHSHLVDGCKVTPWFVKTSAQQDLSAARQLINNAKHGILFLFFNPGVFEQDQTHWTLLQTILERHNASGGSFDQDLYICGVVNQTIPNLTNAVSPNGSRKQPSGAMDPSVSSPSPVTLFTSGNDAPQRLSHDVLVPKAIRDQFHNWEAELLGAGIVNIHSKVIVLDPFGDHPVVMTGSHNMGFKASSANDDNLVIIEGSAALAAAYAINVLAIFQTYRWNGYVVAHEKDPRIWHGLVDTDAWQEGYLTGRELAELRFWLGDAVAAAAETVAGPAAPALAIRRAATGPANTRQGTRAEQSRAISRAKRTVQRLHKRTATTHKAARRRHRHSR